MSATPPPGPAAPTLNIATPQNRTPVIELSWTAVVNATSYLLRRSSQSGAEQPYQTLAATATTYSDTGVAFQALYFYKIRAVVGPSTTSDSNEVSGTPQSLPPRTEKVGNGNHMCGIGSVGAGEGLGWFALLAVLLALRMSRTD